MFARRRTWLILGVVILALGVIAAFFLLRGRSGESIELKQQTDKDGHRYTTLLRDEINRGSNYAKPDDRSAWGTPSDFSRLATTYYHPGSPLGMVLQRFD